MNTPTTTPAAATSRRQFIGTTAAASALTVAQSAWAAGSDEIKVGLIGCGGRGTGAAAKHSAPTKQASRSTPSPMHSKKKPMALSATCETSLPQSRRR